VATTLEQIEQGTAVSLLTTELNSLATATMSAAGTAVNNVQATSNLNGYVWGKVEVVLAAYTGTPTASTAINIWFLLSVDGTNYEDGSNTVTPARMPDVVVPVRAVASGPQRIIVQCLIPVGLFKPIAQNTIGLTLAASGNTVKILANTYQGV
jgi:hypothetical protein